MGVNIRIIVFNIDTISEINDTNFDYKNCVLDLINRGYEVYAVSNVPIKEMNRVIDKLGCNNLLKTHMQNDKVLLKDHYLQIIKETNCDVKSMLVVDANYLGIKIARGLGMNVCLEYSDILSTISYYQDEYSGVCKKTLFKKRINIVIPIMGDNLRFKISSYRMERNLIDFMGKRLFIWAINNLQIDGNYIFIIREHLCRLHHFDTILKSLIPNCIIIKSEKKTEGNACSILLAEKYIDNDFPLIIANDNQWLNWDVETYITDFLLNETALLQMITFISNGNNRYKYIGLKEDNKTVERLSLDKQLSEYALTDVYFWRHGKDFLRYTHRMTSRNQRIVGEFCTTIIANELFDDIKDGKQDQNSIIHRPCNNYFIFQTPNDIRVFENWYTEFQLQPRNV